MQEYNCGCNSPADLSVGVLCLLCHKPCKPLTLNDLSSPNILRVHGGTEGLGQGGAQDATTDTPAILASLGWSNALPWYYAFDSAEIIGMAFALPFADAGEVHGMYVSLLP